MKIEILSNIPIAIKLTIKELPLKLTNGNGVPVRGSIPVIPPKLTTDCKPIIHPIPIAIKHLIKEFNKLYPFIEIIIFEGTYDEIQEWVIDKVIDLGFTINGEFGCESVLF